MRLGIIGKGGIVKTLMQTVKNLPVESMALLVRKDALEAGQAFARTYGMEKVCTDFEELAAWKPDAVYVAVPNHMHYAYSRMALEAGFSVILEKPTCSTASQLRSLLALAERKGLYLLEAMTTWYLPAFEAMKEQLACVGKLRQVNFTYCQRSSRYDAFCEGRVLPAFDPRCSGGSLMDINIYNIAAAVGLFGKPRSVQYFANIQRNIDTSGTMLLIYPDFQVVAMGAKDCGLAAGGTVLGDGGEIRFDGPVSLLSAFTLRSGADTQSFSMELSHRMYPEFVAFSEILRGEKDELYRKMTERSLIVADILETGRKQCGIRFPDDE